MGGSNGQVATRTGLEGGKITPWLAESPLGARIGQAKAPSFADRAARWLHRTGDTRRGPPDGSGGPLQFVSQMKRQLLTFTCMKLPCALVPTMRIVVPVCGTSTLFHSD